eukprot:1149306-Pelagomonas_calceolata.AAC.3
MADDAKQESFFIETPLQCCVKTVLRRCVKSSWAVSSLGIGVSVQADSWSKQAPSSGHWGDHHQEQVGTTTRSRQAPSPGANRNHHQRHHHQEQAATITRGKQPPSLGANSHHH